ncbi:hypothetical protein CMV_023277 [Castanea mollissima]|uniref:Uncharacterized protein n=1 Tax=Castanea mollissima TaxID=60419 RepID=A0A8J4QQ68_9ROSI|nr:hypothetical protein CMV_023277 [Castanea mollissima]
MLWSAELRIGAGIGVDLGIGDRAGIGGRRSRLGSVVGDRGWAQRGSEIAAGLGGARIGDRGWARRGSEIALGSAVRGSEIAAGLGVDRRSRWARRSLEPLGQNLQLRVSKAVRCLILSDKKDNLGHSSTINLRRQVRRPSIPSNRHFRFSQPLIAKNRRESKQPTAFSDKQVIEEVHVPSKIEPK